MLIHALLWFIAARFIQNHYPFPEMLPRSMFDFWDAWHYSAIAVEGYKGIARWAFYPLYPLLVRVISTLTGLRSRPDLVGLVFSTSLFLTFCYLQLRIATSPDKRFHGLKPETIWGWLVFLLWPGSWVFHSHHTESLFLLLSFAAFATARQGRWSIAAVFAGLSALSRNQGVIVAMAVALDSALLQQEQRRRFFVFVSSGLISFLLFSLWPLYQLWATGDPFMSPRAMEQFVPTARSVSAIIGTIWFTNYWQHATWNFYLHHIAFLALHLSVPFLLKRREYALAIYVLLSLWIPLYQGLLENQFRFGTVIFPALFVLGDLMRKLPWSVRLVTFVLLLWLNLVCTWDYAVGSWAY